MLRDADVYDSSFSVKESNDGFEQSLVEKSVVRVCVVFIFLSCSFRLLDDLVLIEIGSTAHQILGDLQVIYLNTLSLGTLHINIAHLIHHQSRLLSRPQLLL